MRYVGADGKARTREESAAGVARMIDGQRRSTASACGRSTLRETGEMIGVCGVVHVDGTGPDVELVYEFQRSALGPGVRDRGRPRLPRRRPRPARPEARRRARLPENAQSIRIMQKLGMRDTGLIEAYGHELVCYEALAARGSDHNVCSRARSARHAATLGLTPLLRRRATQPGPQGRHRRPAAAELASPTTAAPRRAGGRPRRPGRRPASAPAPPPPPPRPAGRPSPRPDRRASRPRSARRRRRRSGAGG